MTTIIELFQYGYILEEVSKLPRTTDTCYVPPSVLDLVDERIFVWGKKNEFLG
jgi:hypothetical protein